MLCNLVDGSPPGSSVRGISQARILGVGCHFLLQGVFLTLGSNLSLLHWQADSLPSDPPVSWGCLCISDSLRYSLPWLSPVQFLFQCLHATAGGGSYEHTGSRTDLPSPSPQEGYRETLRLARCALLLQEVTAIQGAESGPETKPGGQRQGKGGSECGMPSHSCVDTVELWPEFCPPNSR